MAPKETKQTKIPEDYRACDWWRWKYNMRMDLAKEIVEYMKENNIKDTKHLLK
jgi:hypothetical protein